MNVKNTHPAYQRHAKEWRLMRDCMDGETAIKAAGTVYLPKLDSHNDPNNRGDARYASYQFHANFPEMLAPSVAAMVGIAHGKDIKIDMPDAMQALWENADGNGLPLESFHRRITRQLLVTGRYGVLADAAVDGGDPVLVGYSTEAIINWDDEFFVLDESGPVRSGFEWVHEDRQRVLQLDGGRYVQQVYREGTLTDQIEPRMRGGSALNRVPFAVASALDVSQQLHTPPLIGVARAAVRIYNIDAEYRANLLKTVAGYVLLAINGDPPQYVGPGAAHSMEGADGAMPDLKYVEPTTGGAAEQREAQKDARTMAIQAGARLLEQSDQVQESGNARKLRFASETATLSSIIASSCGLLEASLRNIAMMQGLNEEDVVVTPPKDLLDNTMTAQDLAALWGIVELGGMSFEDYYAKGQAGGLFSSERDAQEALGLIRQDGMDTGEAL